MRINKYWSHEKDRQYENKISPKKSKTVIDKYKKACRSNDVVWNSFLPHTEEKANSGEEGEES